MDDRDASRQTEGDERELFEEAMRDVQPLAGDGGPERTRRQARSARSAAHAARVPGDARFEVEVVGERIQGRRPGFDRRRVRRLERGEPSPELTVDLHGFPSAEARGALRDAFRRARRSGLRSIRVIHGRGLGSEAGPVLKTALPRWLAEPPLGSWVLAFASAPPPLGGPGATLVLLRAPKRRRSAGP